ncbi:MAG: hypothetical protein RR563_12010, partial [Acinetobacter sp.]
YHVCVSSVKGGTEKLSQFIKRYAFDQGLFKVHSNFEFDLTDKTGKVWTKYGNAQISSNMLQLDGNGDYLTTSASYDYHFANSEDVTIRFKLKVNAFKTSGIATIFSTYRPEPTNPNYSVRVGPEFASIQMWSSQTPTWAYSIPIGSEVELSFERKSMVWRLYINGDQFGASLSQTTNYTFDLYTSYLGSGTIEGYGSDRDLNGSLSNFQIIKGLAVGDGKSTTARI